MKKIGVTYLSEEILDLINPELFIPPDGYELIGLNFVVREKENWTSRYEEGGPILMANNSLKIKQVYFNPSLPAFKFVDIPEPNNPEVKKMYTSDSLVATSLTEEHPPLGRQAKNIEGELQYISDVSVDFHFAFFTKFELYFLSVLGKEITFSGSKMTFGLMTDKITSRIPEDINPMLPVFTLKAESSLEKLLPIGIDHLDSFHINTKAIPTINEDTISHSATLSTDNTMPGVIHGEPCPTAWFPSEVLSMYTGDPRLIVTWLKKSGKSWNTNIEAMINPVKT